MIMFNYLQYSQAQVFENKTKKYYFIFLLSIYTWFEKKLFNNDFNIS